MTYGKYWGRQPLKSLVSIILLQTHKHLNSKHSLKVSFFYISISNPLLRLAIILYPATNCIPLSPNQESNNLFQNTITPFKQQKMSAQNQGRQSPSPEASSGAQQNSAPSDGRGVNDGTNNQQNSKDQIEELSSNPKGPLDDHVAETAKKTVKNVAGEIKE